MNSLAKRTRRLKMRRSKENKKNEDETEQRGIRK